MFEARDLSSPVAAVRDEHAADAQVYDCDRDFETLPPAQAEELGLVVDALEPASYPADWLPADAPQLLARYASSDLTIGMPGDGSVAWTRQTEPPVVIVKPRVEGSPEAFVDFLLAEAFVEVGLDVPEHFLGFFEDRYLELDETVALDSNGTYQVAAALYDGWVGLQTREVFADWHAGTDADTDTDTATDADAGAHPELADAWQDAGNRLEDRVSGLSRAVARGETDFADATELACASIKHAIELPAPFAALDTEAYRDHGPEYAIRWAEKTFDALAE
ncbi:DUF7089 family protein [Natronolimnohabitans innermongolicus]|uniref:Uncharacterized protein n=1 Tax=Natronolimnohabitans innermongolicus JCM 12255 TaxID=1227499 RepID=L9X0Q5_9EURY|nr:hypothetical protein [Natronolimnohabitans innermongolicus]ELY55001.1 hypothetical protein C493_11657 [Natronolimnohabitans innermongolicus JCM 12255]